MKKIILAYNYLGDHMLNDEQYFLQSITNNLYYLRTIREFCTTIQLSFYKNNQSYIKTAEEFALKCEELGKEILSYVKGNVNELALESNIFVTEYTLPSELLTEKLFGIDLNTSLTEEELEFEGDPVVPLSSIAEIEALNQKALALAKNFSTFCLEIKEKIENLELFSYAYLDFFDYMYKETELYILELDRIINREAYSPVYVTGYEYYFNSSLMKTAEFIQGWINPSERDVSDNASYFINAFQNLSDEYLKAGISPQVQEDLLNKSIALVEQYQRFLEYVLKGVLDGSFHFTTPPTTIDNIYTSANFYYYNLTNSKNLRVGEQKN